MRVEGFTTQNDLDRHRKAIHAVPTSGSIGHRCAAPYCPKGDKLWPRADNFRQHCQRLHPELDTPELMKKSLLSNTSTLVKIPIKVENGTTFVDAEESPSPRDRKPVVATAVVSPSPSKAPDE